jgi:hypothetical protein
MVTPSVDKPVDIMQSQEEHDAEIRLMGLILAQSALVGVGIGIFDAEVWLMNGTPWLNGFTYAMGAFFVQGIAYYVFKMFFEQNLQEKVRLNNLEKSRLHQSRTMQQNFDSRRTDMEMRIQEAQLERELRWMEANPGQMPPSWGVPGGSQSIVSKYEDSHFDTSRIPTHEAKIQQPLTLGVEGETPLKSDGTPDKRYQKKE